MTEHPTTPDPAAGPGPVPPVRPAIPPVRPAVAADLPRIVGLIREHAAYERAEPPAPGLADRLRPLLFGTERDPCLTVLVAEDTDGELLGYAALATEFAFWDGARHLHMDCLYLTEAARGRGLGAALMAAVRDHARSLGLAEVQWQTPEWNTGAIAFYDRLGARSRPKQRYTWHPGR
ncbi:GNAT family N-acetyltransferase [Streptomyces sp. NPDC086023]|uniref:GNAT family N-acetyltransferase n=1 Tax=Streptomyces sp. NPDC086023 TaxID=3365746 RepID=UPI0037D80FAA